MSPEVQNWSINDPTKRTCVLLKLKEKDDSAADSGVLQGCKQVPKTDVMYVCQVLSSDVVK